MTRERAVVRLLADALAASVRDGEISIILARRRGRFARATMYQALELRNAAMRALFGPNPDGHRALWPFLSQGGQATVLTEALRYARGERQDRGVMLRMRRILVKLGQVRPDVRRRANRERRRRSMSPAERERYWARPT